MQIVHPHFIHAFSTSKVQCNVFLRCSLFLFLHTFPYSHNEWGKYVFVEFRRGQSTPSIYIHRAVHTRYIYCV